MFNKSFARWKYAICFAAVIFILIAIRQTMITAKHPFQRMTTAAHQKITTTIEAQISSQKSHAAPVLTVQSIRPTRFDIVVSYFKENITKVVEQLNDLKAIPQLEQYDEVRVFIYTKDKSADHHALETALGGKVTMLPNKGREAGAYLAHILRNWNDIAAHTMFVQASMHFRAEGVRRASEYLVPPTSTEVPSTGLLTLGYLSGCQCTSCHDSWDGSVTWSRISELYVLLNHEMCPKDIVITYLGQFIVSRKRILRRRRETYQYIKDVLQADMDHWIHSDPRRDGFEDSTGNPFFGHSMERAWMVLWDCNDVTILDKCGNGLHSLLTGRAKEDAVDKCQCMDL